MTTTSEQQQPEVAETDLIIEELKQKYVQSLQKKEAQLIEQANNKADTILANAYQDSLKLADKAKEEADQIIAGAHQQADELMLKSQQAVEQLTQHAENEVSRRLISARQQSEDIINEAKTMVKTQIEEFNQMIAKTQQSMFQISEIALKKFDNPGGNGKSDYLTGIDARPVLDPNTDENEKSPDNSTSQVVTTASRKENTASPEKGESKIPADESQLRQGRMKIEFNPTIQNEQLSELESDLLKTLKLSVLSKSLSKQGIVYVDVEVYEPAPILETLRSLPGVAKVIDDKNKITVSLKSK